MKMIRILLITAISFFCVAPLKAQIYNIFTEQGRTIATCVGTFTDAGGVSSDYSTNQNLTVTFCPTTPGEVIKVVFTQLDIRSVNLDTRTCEDWLYVYQGSSATGTPDDMYCGTLTGNNLPIIISSAPDGCISFRFQSDNAGNAAGWIANVSCVTRCNNPTAALTDLTPITICPMEALNPGNPEVIFDGSPSFVSPLYPAQTFQSLVYYDWNFGDGTLISTATTTAISTITTTSGTTHTYDLPGIYVATLRVRDNNTDIYQAGCQSTNTVSRLINVLPPPKYDGASPPTVNIDCGEFATLTAAVVSQTKAQKKPTAATGVVSLPDGKGISYLSGINFSGFFPNGATLTSGCYPTVKFSMEHSWAGDVIIELIAPNGQTVRLFDRVGESNKFGSCVNGANNGSPGCPAQYTVVNNGGLVWPLPGFGTQTTTTPCGTFTCEFGNYIRPLTYNSSMNFNVLNGAPLNGTWTLKVTDFHGLDDGVLTDWKLEFPDACYKPLLSVTPDYLSLVWTGLPSSPPVPTQTTTITTFVPGQEPCPVGNNCDGNKITNKIIVGPFPNPGSYPYKYHTIDDLGCEYEKTVTVVVTCPCPEITLPSTDQVICSGTDPTTFSVHTTEQESKFIIFKYYPTPPAVTDPYMGGTFLAAVSPSNGVATYDPTPFDFPLNMGTTPLTYTVYAILGVLPIDPLCRPFQEITVIIDPQFSASVSYAGPFCSTVTSLQSVTITGQTGGSFSAAPGLSLNPLTGEINPSLSTPGTYLVSYFVPAINSCGPITASVNVTITTLPTAAVSYTGPICTNTSGTISPTSSSTGFGTFTSLPGGLSLNSLSGNIVPSMSSAGSYVVSYTIAPTGGCPSVIATTSLTIGLAPTAIISYDSPFCSSSTTLQTVTLTGNSGGTYSSSSGLSVDASTGNILPNTSIGGSYVVSYTVTTAEGCITNATAPITITTAQVATITYPVLCNNNTNSQNVTLVGSTGGTYSSTPAGLTIDAVDGSVVASTSTVGTYTVSYTIPASAGCAAFATNAQAVITQVDDPSFTYSSGTYCQTDTDPSATITGGSVGTFTSGTGLVFLNSTTGLIDLSASTGGSYIITYTTNGVCKATQTFPITVTGNPIASFSYGVYCQYQNNALPTFVPGGSAGVFSSTAGLVFVNTSTGEVDLTLSTPGTYTVTNFIAAIGTCNAATADNTVIIHPSPVATISYTDNFICTSDPSQMPLLTGTAGGTYTSAPAGLGLNSATGEISPALSAGGMYVVSYTVAIGQCYATATFPITVTALPVATISYNAPFCSNISNPQNVIFNGTIGGTYTSSPSGLSLSPTTGAIVPNTSTIGSYIVSYTIAAAGACAEVTAITTLSIVAAPSATISYTSPFCSNLIAPQSVTLNGTSGGTYTASTGLSINASNGEIIPSLSTEGTYVVSYTVELNGCLITTTAPVTITYLPVATISYNSPFCSSQGTLQNVTFTGTTGGTYTSSPSGLFFDAVHGGITPSLSTGNNYIVSYTIAAAGGCPSVVATAPVTVTVAPVATISYAGPYCENNVTAQPVIFTGTSGGTYTSAVGLSLNNTTGAISPNLSTVAMHVVSYTIAASGGCPKFVTTASVTISPVQVATISYDDAFCKNITTLQNVIFVGTTGGTYTTDPAGLFLDSRDGSILPSSSMAGTYTIIYSLPSGTCPAFSTNDVVVINAVDNTSFTYVPNSFCQTDADPVAMVNSSSVSGTFTAPTGIVFANAATAQIDLSASTAGTYLVTFTSNGVCPSKSTTPITITQPPEGNFNYSGPYCQRSANVLPTLASGSTAGLFTASPSGLIFANANTGQIDMTNSQAGNYTVTNTIAAVGACPVTTTTAPLVVLPAPTIANAASDQSICAVSTTLQANTPAVGSGTWTVVSGFGTIQNPSSPTTSISNLSFGTNTFQWTIQNGICPSTTDVVNITAKKSPQPGFQNDINSGCTPLCINFIDTSTAQGGAIVTSNWIFGDGSVAKQKNTEHCYDDAGKYSVSLQVTADNGCVASFTKKDLIQVYPKPTANFSYAPEIVTSDLTTVTFMDRSSSDVTSWQWNFGDKEDTLSSFIANPIHIYPDSVIGDYLITLIVQNINACSDTIQRLVNIKHPEFCFYIPNAFTPNGDGKNDGFYAKGVGIVTYQMQIFDRWGLLIFESDNIDKHWNGKHKEGKEVQDAYVWKVKLTDVYGVEHKYYGVVTLIK